MELKFCLGREQSQRSLCHKALRPILTITVVSTISNSATVIIGRISFFIGVMRPPPSFKYEGKLLNVVLAQDF
jgi:hypothetical protein